jgi:glycosyltransferase involved in cell wall biosynthesis
MSRILFISYVSNQHSGVGNRVYYLSRELAKRGHEVHVITKQGEYVSKEVNAYYVQIPKHIFKIPPVPLPQVSIFNLLAYKKFEEIKHKIKPDLIDVQHVHVSPIVHMIKEKNNLVLTCHGTEIGRTLGLYGRVPVGLMQFTSTIEKYTFSKLNRIIAVSTRVKREIIDYYNISREKILLIPNGIDISEFKNKQGLGLNLHSKFNADYILINVGGYSKIKGIYEVIKALKYIRDLNWIFIVIGGGPRKDLILIKKFLKQYNLDNRVLLLGSLKKELVKNIVQEADVYLHPSLYESFGIAVLEAMALKKPIVAFRINSLKEIVNDAGILVNVGDIFGLANAIRNLLEDSELRKNLALKAYERALKYDWNNIASIYEDFALNKVKNKKNNKIP